MYEEKNFQVLMAIVVMWTLDILLTVYDYFPEGDPARADIKLEVIYNAAWFRVPYPGQVPRKRKIEKNKAFIYR